MTQHKKVTDAGREKWQLRLKLIKRNEHFGTSSNV